MKRKAVATRHPGVFRVDAQTFRVRARVLDPKTGRFKEIDRLVNTEDPKKAVEERLKFIAEIVAPPAETQRPRLADYASSWLRSKLPTVKPGTRHYYTSVLALHIVPVLGDHYVDAITADDIHKWRGSMRAANSTLNTRWWVLKMLLRSAVYDLDLAKDPTRRVIALPVVRNEDDPNCLTPDELSRLLAVAAARRPHVYPLLCTLALTGARFGEATALKWSDIDEDAGIIMIRRAQWRRKIGTTKTGVIRSVPLVPELTAVLRTHRANQLREQHPGLANEWVFPARRGGLVSNSYGRDSLAFCVRKAGIEARFTIHGLRRTFNNIMRQVTTGEVVRAMMGHATVDMTEHYSHIGHSEKRGAAARFTTQVSIPALPEKIAKVGTAVGTPRKRARSEAQGVGAISPESRSSEAMPLDQTA